MGYAKHPVAKPETFLKAHEKEFTHQFPNPPRPRDPNAPQEEVCKKPAVPRHNEQPLLGLKTNKNFISQNAVDTIMTVPRKPEKNMVDTRNGKKIQLGNKWLTTSLCQKEEF